MTLAADIRFISSTARAGFVFVRRGLVPEACSTWLLPKVEGIQQAAEWLYSGHVFDAEEALRGRLVRSVHDPDQLLAPALTIVAGIASHSAPLAVAATGQMLWRAFADPGPRQAHERDSHARYVVGAAPERGEESPPSSTSETQPAGLFVNDTPVPVANPLGEEGHRFAYLTAHLPQDRLGIAVASVAAAGGALEHALAHGAQRRAFGQRNRRLPVLALHAGRGSRRRGTDPGLRRPQHRRTHTSNTRPEDAALTKWRATEMQARVVDRCLQVFGDYGYMAEYPIARAYVARVNRIYGGTNEIIREIVGRALEARWTPQYQRENHHAPR